MEFEVFNPMVGVQSGYTQVLRFFPPNVTTQILLVSEMWSYRFGVANLSSKFDCSNPFPRCGDFNELETPDTWAQFIFMVAISTLVNGLGKFFNVQRSIWSTVGASHALDSF